MASTVTLQPSFAEAMRFEPESRRKLAGRILANVRADELTEAAQFDELHRRREAVQTGRMPLIAGKDALRQVREATLGHA
ncbi:MAG: hypothetical protein IAE77_24890 [Prosthecobacter sp.]|jgi:hypothetical protein|uniref:addiction module protein n=1 Tax=Prosthecobacter sp. TaxID=1965333 RepID=UPI0019ED57DC|nr:addiction module protein [Prosthecobacter sp.]MBE2286717.1 hypothetical protein [Prosthecobacter sp.]